MTTATAGGKISARIAITGQAQSALTFNDPVRIVGDYQFDKGNAATACIGYVITPNVARGTGSLAGTYPQPLVPGDCTVEVIGHAVNTVLAGTGGVAAGNAVSVSAGGTYVVGAITDVSFVGFALTTAAAGASFDLILV